MKGALILMTRIPIPGKTKTRLMSVLSGDECARIHRAFLMDLFLLFNSLKDKVDIYLTYTPEDSFGIIADIIPSYIGTFAQRGDSLGDKMKNAISHVLDKGYESVCLMGSDIPQVTEKSIIECFNRLDTKDCVIAPTFDGGYYLVGLKKMNDKIFDNKVKWGNKTVLEGTMDILNSLELNVSLGDKYRDIDTLDDLIDFKIRLEKGEFPNSHLKYTKEYVNNIWSWYDELDTSIRG
ncbi:TIGR04282 family arsenosugar biosynthesis glycosyltransferase [Senegalia massiliensis]|jgi:rSAM/selenodomain-associated transferase 1|uniref:TIGR04282 family arsenosugar biosynthesis glycosyltransferase n=1 Tax=Senegalia massiliensis TaxID=1720316 RepID=UPI001030C69E|nr:TIGR04282 family arsenosugar biosynthesis glycosyltransferase [Senegalia massiliensis]